MPVLGKWKYVRGDRPFHQHICAEIPTHLEAPGDEAESHLWLCNSPYCNSARRRCPDHGGTEPRFDE